MTSRVLCVVLVSLLVLRSGQALASDDVTMLSIQDVLNAPRAREKLDGSVKFYFGKPAPGKVLESKGLFVANPKTNSFAKSVEKACDWAALSALISLQQRAKALGANAVVNIQSYYKRHEVTSETQFECHKGFLIAGVALRGEVVRLARP